MKKLLFYPSLLIIMLFCSFAPAEWVKIQSKEGRYSILFPNKPTESEQSVETEIGAMQLKVMMYEVGKFKDDNAVYGIIYADYPDTLIHSDFKDEIIDAFFENSINGAAKNMKGTVLSEKKVAYKNYPGRHAVVSFMEGEGIMHLQIFLVKNRGYILEVGCETKKDNNPAIDKFFQSFVLEEGQKK